MTRTAPQALSMTAAERRQCETIAALNLPLVSQRARALLLIDSGSSQAEAASRTGLSGGQLRYAVTRFKNLRLAMFPPEIIELRPVSPETTTPAPSAQAEKPSRQRKNTKESKKKGKKSGKKKQEKSKNKQSKKKARTAKKDKQNPEDGGQAKKSMKKSKKTKGSRKKSGK